MSEALKQTCQYYCATEKDSYYSKHLEAVLLGLIYAHYDCERKQDYNWHLVLSDVHDTREAHMHTLNTTYSQLTNSSENLQQDGFVSAQQVDTLKHLRYHHTLHASFIKNGKERRLNVIVWNQRYEAGGVEQLWKNGFKSMSSDWKD